MLNAVSRDQRVPDVIAGISAISKFAFVLFCYYKKIISNLNVSLDFVSGNIKIRFLENKFHCFPQDQSLSVNCYIARLSESLMITLIGCFLVMCP